MRRVNGYWTATMLRSVAFALLVLLVFSSCSPSVLPRHTHVVTLPSQGLYEECRPDEGVRCLDRLKRMAAAGFDLVLNYSQLYGTAAEELAYARQAQALGMKVIWALDDPLLWKEGQQPTKEYTELASSCNCSTQQGLVRYVVNLVKELPATWGYYVGDELREKDHARVKALADYIHQLDPSHPRLYIASAHATNLGTSLTPFVDTAEVVGVDYYPVGNSEPISAMAEVANSVQDIADRHDKQVAIVLQAFSLAEYPTETRQCTPRPSCAPFPTRGEMRQMRDLALEYASPSLLLWYSYFDVARSNNPTGHWQDLVAAAGTLPRTISGVEG